MEAFGPHPVFGPETLREISDLLGHHLDTMPGSLILLKMTPGTDIDMIDHCHWTGPTEIVAEIAE